MKYIYIECFSTFIKSAEVRIKEGEGFTNDIVDKLRDQATQRAFLRTNVTTAFFFSTVSFFFLGGVFILCGQQLVAEFCSLFL